MSTTTPNMSLLVSTIGVDSGSTWESNLNTDLSLLDSHNHASGNGVQITPAGLNISSNLTFAGNQATNLQAAQFTAQAALVTLNALYVKGVDLYYNDGSGNVIKMTSGGTVNATSSGIASGTATASFASGILDVLAATSVPAPIFSGPIQLSNSASYPNYVQVQAPSTVTSTYSLTLPPVPASLTSVVTIDTSGNLKSSVSMPATPTTTSQVNITPAGNFVALPASATLIFGASVTLDASVSQSIYYLTCTSATNPTIQPPINAQDGKRIVIVFQASTSGNTLGLSSSAGGFQFGTTFSTIFPTVASTTDYIGCIFRASTGYWDVVGYTQGYTN